MVDARLSRSEALAQNPFSLCPEEILHEQKVIEVTYLGFDAKKHLGQMVVALGVAAEVRVFFEEAWQCRFPIHAVIPAADPRFHWDDELLMWHNITSGFNFRQITGQKQLSLHAQGRAFDVNPALNPYERQEGKEWIVRPTGAMWRPGEPGVLDRTHPLVRMMVRMGWEWGGDWTKASGRIDYQHFQKRP